MIDHLVTVLISTSPSPKHPSTRLIEDTIATIRWHLPEAQILICCDGVRKEQEDRRAAYSEFVLRLQAISTEKWRNIRLIVQPTFLHQAWTIAKGLEQVTTPLILFTEHDQYLLSIMNPWDDFARAIMERHVNLIRFMLEDVIPPEWNHLMLGPVCVGADTWPLTKTVQWSQRTHLASVEYYRWMIEKHLKPGDRCYLEDRMYGLCDEWADHKLTLFTPGGAQQRIWHSDGRGEDSKFESVLE